MKITVDGSDSSINNIEEFREKLTHLPLLFREIWLSKDYAKSPALCILISGELSTMTFFPIDRHPGMNSLGDSEHSSSDKSIEFKVHGETHEIPERFVVPRDTSIKAALSFFEGHNPPLYVNWEEL